MPTLNQRSCVTAFTRVVANLTEGAARTVSYHTSVHAAHDVGHFGQPMTRYSTILLRYHDLFHDACVIYISWSLSILVRLRHYLVQGLSHITGRPSSLVLHARKDFTEGSQETAVREVYKYSAKHCQGRTLSSGGK